MFVPAGRAINPITGTNWEGTGVEPRIEVPASQALNRAQVEALRGLIEAAVGDDQLRERLKGILSEVEREG